jgi:hypothetical protein
MHTRKLRHLKIASTRDAESAMDSGKLSAPVRLRSDWHAEMRMLGDQFVAELKDLRCADWLELSELF